MQIPKSVSRLVSSRSGGFSLVEMAIVLIVLGVMARATLVPVAALDASRRERLAKQGVNTIRDALVAHLISHGEFPCPLTHPESSTCALRGAVPTRQLALNFPIADSGAALDPWGRPYLYALSDSDSMERGTRGQSDWAAADDVLSVGLSGLRGSLVICRDDRAPCPSAVLLAEDLVFVVASLGADASTAGLQGLNQSSGGNVFTHRSRSQVDEYRYDDELVWLSRSEAVWWLLRAARLP